MDLQEEIIKMNLYKTFEPFIEEGISLSERAKGNITLKEGAPEEAVQALAKWKAIKMKQRLF